MPELESSNEDRYWSQDILLCETTVRGYGPDPVGVRSRVHRAEEPYRRGRLDRTVENLRTLQGSRVYYHLRPYVLEPEMRVIVALQPQVGRQNRIGTVVDSIWEGMRQREIAQVQAWHYPADELTVIWEAYLYAPFRAAQLGDDAGMAALWDGIERFMRRQFPTTKQLVTPFHDPEFDDEAYEAFLRSRGYGPITQAAYGKTVE